jgi:hypothetical protein
MIAASILNARGIRNFTEIEGGFNKIKGTSVPKPILSVRTAINLNL